MEERCVRLWFRPQVNCRLRSADQSSARASNVEGTFAGLSYDEGWLWWVRQWLVDAWWAHELRSCCPHFVRDSRHRSTVNRWSYTDTHVHLFPLNQILFHGLQEGLDCMYCQTVPRGSFLLPTVVVWLLRGYQQGGERNVCWGET